MTKSTDGQLEKVNVRLWRHDLAWLKKRYADNYNGQIRRIVANWVIRARRLENATFDESKTGGEKLQNQGAKEGRQKIP